MDASTYTHDPNRWYPTTPAEYGRMLREEAERELERLTLSFRYGDLPTVHDLAERIAARYETRQGPAGMEYRLKPVEARW